MRVVAPDHRNAEVSASVKVWDPLVRAIHWSLAVAIMAAFMSDESQSLHRAIGYFAASLVSLRCIWGFVGPQHARFADFVRPPGAVIAYLRDVARQRPRRYLGHNPAGGVMTLALLGLVLITAFSGWLSMTDRFFGVSWVEDIHAASANLMIGLVVLHVSGAILSSILHHENLVLAMITGYKPIETTVDEMGHGEEGVAPFQSGRRRAGQD